MIGAVFCEMMVDGQVEFKDKRILRRKPSKLKEPVYRIIHEKLRNSNREKKLSTWLQRLYFSSSRIKKEIRKSLLMKGFLRRKEKRWMGVFSYNQYLLRTPEYAEDLLDEMIQWIRTPHPVDIKRFMLMYLVVLSGTGRRIFGRQKLKEFKNILSNQLKNPNYSSEHIVFLNEMVKVIGTLSRMNSGKNIAIGSSS